MVPISDEDQGIARAEGVVSTVPAVTTGARVVTSHHGGVIYRHEGIPILLYA